MRVTSNIWSKRFTPIRLNRQNTQLALSNLLPSTPSPLLLSTMSDAQDPAKTRTHPLHYENVRYILCLPLKLLLKVICVNVCEIFK